ncbi:DUF2489 domain-containing protein [Arsukibacterium sp.]|uniref:DUF2489 domain-containing protein n=1 Tax=Arsukibacterium sp. TaxID=1977258 RepID=UPI002FD91D64
MTVFWWCLLAVGVCIVAGLAFYAGRLLWQLQLQRQQQQQQQQKQQLQQQEKRDYLQQSILLISKAMQQDQCELSEGALRLWVLLDHWPDANKPDAEASYPGLFKMYQVVKDMPTHKARKAQDKKLTRQQDKLRLQAELDYKVLIIEDVTKLIVRFSDPADNSTATDPAVKTIH